MSHSYCARRTSGRLVVLDDAGGQPEERVELTHALGVAAGEVVVHGHDMDATSGEGVEVDGKCRHEGLSLAGRHLGDAPLVEHHAADELDVEVDHVPDIRVVADGELGADHATCGVLHHGEGLGEDLVEALLEKLRILDLGEFLLPGGGLLAEGLVGKRLQGLLNLVDAGDDREHPAHLALILRTDDFLQDSRQTWEKGPLRANRHFNRKEGTGQRRIRRGASGMGDRVEGG